MDLYSSGYRRVLAAVPASLLAVTGLMSFHEYTSQKLDACFIARELEHHPPTYIPLADSQLHNVAVFAVWAAMLFLLALPKHRIRAAYALAYTVLWFHCTYILLAALKAPLDDFNCAGRHILYPNGISGHYCYFVFVSLTAPLLVLARLRSNPRPSKSIVGLASACLVVYTVGATATLYRTLTHGYHSPRQILLGTALGMGSHVILDHFFLDHDNSISKRTPAVGLIVLASKSIVSISLYSILWPFSTAGPAITPPHIAFHVTMWCILLICSYSLPVHAEKAVA